MAGCELWEGVASAESEDREGGSVLEEHHQSFVASKS